MTKMTDTEGAEVPLDDDGSELFDLTLWGDGKMSMTAPWFETDKGIYDSPGYVLEVDLRDILQEYLRDAKQVDDGDGLLPLAKMLREFADSYEHAAATWKTPNVGIEPPYSVGSNDGLGVCPIDATILESK